MIRVVDIPSICGSLLRAHRKRKGYSLEILAGKADIHAATVGRAESGIIRSDTRTVNALAEALEIHPASLYDPEEWAAFLACHVALPTDAPVGDQVGPELDLDESPDPRPLVPDREILARYNLIPRSFAGARFRFEFVNGEWESVNASEAECLSQFGLICGECVELGGLPPAVIYVPSDSEPIGEVNKLYASGEMAQTVLEIKTSARIEVIARAVYGILPDRWAVHMTVHSVHVDEFTGLSIEKVVGVTT